jgi:hypothetical protein
LSTQSEIKSVKIPWVPIILLMVVFGFLGPMYTSISPNAAWYSLGAIGCKTMILVLPLIFIMGTALIGRITGRPISPVTYTFLYAAAISLIASTTEFGFPIEEGFMQILYDRVGVAAELNPWPLLLVPDAEVVAPMVTGHVAVPWGAWVPTFMWWWLLSVGFAVFALGWGVVWRRRWIDVEKVPFPHARVAIELVERVTGAEKSIRTRFGMPFMVGAILGIAFQLPLLLAYMFPWFPDIYGWRTNTCLMGASYITADSPLAGIAGLAQLNKNPAVGAIFYLAPLNVLLGTWVWYLVFAVLMQVAFTMGYYTGITGNAGCGRVWCGTSGYRVGEPFKWDVFSSSGVTTGIFIGYILLNWKYLAETFNAAIGKIGKEKLDELERFEPTSYRNAYLMIAASTILIIAILMVAGVGLPAALLMVITNVIITLVATRSYALVGFVVPGGSWFYYGPIKTLLSGAGVGGGNREWYVAMTMNILLVNEPVSEGGYTFPLTASLQTYQMAGINKVPNKMVFKILLIVNVVAPLLSALGAIWAFYTFGVTKMQTSASLWYSAYSTYSPTNLATRPAYEPWWPNMIAGIIFAGLLSFMHARFVWFPLEPIGFLLATDGHALIEGVWTMALAAWVVKTITLRVGGSKLYERTGIPTAIGFIVGIVIVSLIGGVVLVTRFFIPF